MLKITKNQGSIQVTADKSGFYPFDGTITFPTNSLFTATSANTDMITFKSTSNGDVQFVGNYKDITISGRSYDTKQKFLTAFSNLANQGSVDAYTKAETDAKLKNKLTAQTNAKDALFIRSYSNDDANSSVALYHSTVKGSNDVAIGYAATNDKEGLHNLAILNEARANGMQNIAIGNDRKCNGTRNVGIGCGAFNTVDVFGADNVCIGSQSQAHTEDNAAVNNSIAIGSTAKASSNFCTVVGNSAEAKSSHAVAVGDSAYVEHDCDSSVAVGNSARAYGKGSVAIGTVSYADNDKPLDICCGQRTDGTPLNVIQSDANGKISLLKGNGTDERLVIQDEIEALKNAGGGGTVDAYTKAETDTKLDAKQDKLTAGSGITITKDETAGTSTIATAVSLTDNGNGAYQVGDSIKMGYGIAIGKNTDSSSSDSIAVGRAASTTGSSAIAIGTSSSANGDNSIAIGCDTINDAINSVSIGYLSRAGNGDDDGSVIIGAAANGASGTTSTLIGYSANSSGFACTGIGPTARVDDATPLVIKAGHKTVSDGEQILTMIQGDANGKISLLKGDGTDERMVIQDEIEALKNAGGSGGGTVDAYTKAETDNLLNAKQNTLTAGTGITIDENNVISSTGGSGGSANPYVNVKGTNESATIADNVTFGIAIGERTNVTKDEGIAIGGQSKAQGRYCVSVGRLSTCIGDSTVAIGDNAKTMMGKSVAIGSAAYAMSKNAIAIGPGANATSNMPLVIKASDNGLGAALPMIQGDKDGKISIPLGDGTLSTMCLQDEIAALKAEIAALKGGASTGDTTGA